MNSMPQESNWSELELQRCVDGELSRDQCRELLHRLDQVDQESILIDSSRGWKELALLFVEHRLLQQGCREYVKPVPDIAVLDPSVAKPRRAASIAWPMVAAALCIGLALPLATVGFRSAWLSGAGGSPVAAIPNAAIPDPGTMLAPGTLVIDGPETSGSVADAAPAKPVMQAQLATSDTLGETSGESLSIPIYAAGDVPVGWPQHESFMSDEFVELLRQQGYSVETVPQLFNVDLEDGSRVILPAKSILVRDRHH